MKKIILPIIGAIALPIIFSQVNPDIEPLMLILAAGVGIGIGSGLNALIFRKDSSETDSEKDIQGN